VNAEQLSRAGSLPNPDNRYEICENNLLWKMGEDRKVRLCIPELYRGDILKIIHDELVHPRAARCWEFAQKHYF